MDPDRMAQALGNILSNAIKFTPPGGEVSIAAEYSTGQLTIHVIDSGPGIPPEEQNQIFQPFYRGSQGKRIVEGMGLSQITDEGAVRDIVRRVIEANPSQVADYRAGKTKVMGFLVGQAMKESKGRAKPDTLNRLLAEELARENA
jgi:K+-sensing histidine kinase KdpD